MPDSSKTPAGEAAKKDEKKDSLKSDTTTLSSAQESKKESGKDNTTKDNKKKNPQEEELSEEDEKLKNELELLVERLKESDSSLYANSLELLKNGVILSIAWILISS